MGLKTTNYKIASLGITIPTAYAILKNLHINGDVAIADFAIQSTRDAAINLQPLHLERIRFDVNRLENPFVTAYNIAKGTRETMTQSNKIVVKMPFFGWEDDKT